MALLHVFMWFVYGLWILNVFYVKNENEGKWDVSSFDALIFRKERTLQTTKEKKITIYGDGPIASFRSGDFDLNDWECSTHWWWPNWKTD